MALRRFRKAELEGRDLLHGNGFDGGRWSDFRHRYLKPLSGLDQGIEVRIYVSATVGRDSRSWRQRWSWAISRSASAGELTSGLCGRDALRMTRSESRLSGDFGVFIISMAIAGKAKIQWCGEEFWSPPVPARSTCAEYLLCTARLLQRARWRRAACAVFTCEGEPPQAFIAASCSARP